jgi:hypothetical protein
MEWGSVQIQIASISLTFDKPGIFLKQVAMSSFDSNSSFCHGGHKNRLHVRHECIVNALGIPLVMSTLDRKQVTHMFDGLCSISMPHMQHNTVGIVAVNMLDIVGELVELEFRCWSRTAAATMIGRLKYFFLLTIAHWSHQH